MIIDIITIEYINRRINLWELEKRFYELEMENQKNYYYKNLLKNQKIYFNEMAHEFKSPLTNIIGYSKIIKNNEFTDIEFFNRGIDSVISETKRLDKMSTSLLDVYKDDFENLNKSNYIDVNLSKLVTDISQSLFLNKASKKNIKIKLDVEENIEFNCDELELMSIVNNLVDNSIKYSKERTIIKVSLKEDDSYLISPADGGGWINITVLDAFSNGDGTYKAIIDVIADFDVEQHHLGKYQVDMVKNSDSTSQFKYSITNLQRMKN